LDPLLLVTLAYLMVGVLVFCRLVGYELWSLEWLLGVLLLWPVLLLMWAVGWRLTLRPAEGSATSDATVMVGQHGVTVSELRPTGKVEIAGRTHDARADEYIARGVRVVVVDVGGFELRVRPASETFVDNAEAKCPAS
jgi:membrane-bound ClpP family serine protease